MKLDLQNPLHAFAEWVTGVDDQWSELAIERAGNAFTDVTAVMIAGAPETVSKKVYALAKSWGAGHCSAVGFEAMISSSDFPPSTIFETLECIVDSIL